MRLVLNSMMHTKRYRSKEIQDIISELIEYRYWIGQNMHNLFEHLFIAFVPLGYVQYI